MNEEEKEFLYSTIKYLKETAFNQEKQLEILQKQLSQSVGIIEEQAKVIEKHTELIAKIVDDITNPENAKMRDIAYKMAYIKNIAGKK